MVSLDISALFSTIWRKRRWIQAEIFDKQSQNSCHSFYSKLRKDYGACGARKVAAVEIDDLAVGNSWKSKVKAVAST